MRGSAPIVPLVIVFLILVGRYAAYGASTPSQGPSALALTVTLQPLPADGGSYPSLMVSVNDASGNPTMTLSDVTIFLSSSQEGFATVPSSVELMAGRTYVLVNVTTTQKPGTTVITAASGGLKAASVDFHTVATAQTATQLALSISPSKTLQSFVSDDAFLAVQLENASSLPAYSNNYTQVVITSSNITVVENTVRIMIPPGESYAIFPIKAKNSGLTTFTALSGGLVSSSASLSILPLPLSVSVTASPNPFSANETTTVTVLVSLAGQGLSSASITLSSNIGTFTPTESNTDDTGRALATFTSQSAGVATVVASVEHHYIGQRNASVAIIILRPTPPVAQSPFQFIYPFIPVIFALVIIGVVIFAVRRVLRRRMASMREEGKEE